MAARVRMQVWAAVVMVAMVVATAGVGGQTTQDCTSAYTYVTPCLAFVTGNGTTPSQECCTDINYLNTNNAACLCQIVEQLKNSSTPAVNATKAYELPAQCGITVNTAQCPAFALPPGTAVAPTPPYLAPSANAPGSPGAPAAPAPGSSGPSGSPGSPGSPGAPAPPASAAPLPLPRARGSAVALLLPGLGAASVLWNALFAFV